MLNLEFNLTILSVRHRVIDANRAIADPMDHYLITCICVAYGCKNLYDLGALCSYTNKIWSDFSKIMILMFQPITY